MQNSLSYTQTFILNRLRNDETNFYGYEEEFKTIHDLLKKTVEFGESNSALIIGPPRSGKSTILSSAISSLFEEKSFVKSALIVRLDGTLDTDDSIALRTATTQMELTDAVEGQVFGSYAENLHFLLACLKQSNKNKSKSIVFILDHFDLFCAHPKQSLLYNLFDVVQSAQAAICVIGLTSRNDVLELLEKRVKSRFSHRQISLYPGDVTFRDRIDLYKELMTLPDKLEMDKIVKRNATRRTYQCRFFDVKPFVGRFEDSWLTQWNQMIDKLFSDKRVQTCLEDIFESDVTLEVPKQIFAQLVSRLQNTDTPQIKAEDLLRICATYELDEKVQLYSDISVVEVMLLIAIKHHAEIYDREVFNFEMILSRCRKFQNSPQSQMESVERSIALRAFEHLNMLEIFEPINTTAAKMQKEFQMHKLLLTNSQIHRIIKNYPHLPTDISQWALSSLV